ncbi:MAG: hypothetical protein QM820_33185 [Minicystis sp.]
MDPTRAAILVAFSLGLLACGSSSPHGEAGGAGGGSALDTASVKFPDMRSLWSNSIARACGPNNGVCHDNKQFPDLQTANGLLASVNVRCNQLRDDPAQIDNLCEPPGDTLQVGSFATRVGNITPKPDAMAPTTIDITLADPIPAGATADMLSIVRERDGLPPVSLPVPSEAAMLMPGERVITLDLAALQKEEGFAYGQSLADFFLPAKRLAGAGDQIELGDPNGDGVFGATLGGALIKPGKPLLSYLFLRISGPLVTGPDHQETSVLPSSTVEQQMPIANYQYWDATNANLALWCWISTMKDDGSNADGPIDYAHCDTSKIAPIKHQDGEAVTYSHVYEQILHPSCTVPCHFSGTKQPTKLFLDDPGKTYEILLGLHGERPEGSDMPFVTRNDPSKSFLFLKISEEKPPVGGRMPLSGPLRDDQIQDVQTWIAQGAYQN